MPGRPASPEGGASGIDVWGVAAVSTVRGAFAEIVEGFPIELRFEESGPDTLRLLLRQHGEVDEDPEIDLVGVASEAARTLIDPADAARLELDRLLLGLTGMWR